MEYINSILNGDSCELLCDLEDNSVDLIITSPPYDKLRKYNGVGNSWNFEKFQCIAQHLSRVLKDGGVIVWIVNDAVENGSRTCTSYRQCLYFVEECGLNLNDTMIWKKTNPMPQVKQKRYSDCFEYMFVFSKGYPKTFNPIKVPCKYGGQNYNSTAKNIGGENGRRKLNYNVNLEKVKENVWDFGVSGNRKTMPIESINENGEIEIKEIRHPAVFPIDIVIDHIKSWSNEGDIVLDPFIGSGTVAIASILTNRKYIGIELNKDYYNLCLKNINELNNSTEIKFNE